MSYPITKKLIQKNVSGEWLDPIGVVLHETANEGSPAFSNHFDYFNNAHRGASAHYFVDWSAIGLFVPEDRVAWHAGYKANHRYLSVEMCNSKDPAKFLEVWKRTVWLIADMFYRYGWTIDTSKTLVTHEWVTKNLGGTNHVDPTAYLKQHGKSFDIFVGEVRKALVAMKIPATVPVTKPTVSELPVTVYVQGVKITDKAILIGGSRTIVPVKDIATAYGLGAFVGYDNLKKQASIKGDFLETTELRNNTSYAWSRDIADAMKATILWDAPSRTLFFT